MSSLNCDWQQYSQSLRSLCDWNPCSRADGLGWPGLLWTLYGSHVVGFAALFRAARSRSADGTEAADNQLCSGRTVWQG